MHTEEEVLNILLKSKSINAILDTAFTINLPDYYLAGGAIAQTVWNYLCGFDLEANISDYDLGYFEATDLSQEGEQSWQLAFANILPDIHVELVNQARVHLWYANYFGSEIEPYLSADNVVERLPYTVSCIGVRKTTSEDYFIYAPYGVTDVFNLILRVNEKSTIDGKYLRSKHEKWSKVWPVRLSN